MELKKLILFLFVMLLLTGCSKNDLRKPIPYEVIHESHLSYSEKEIIPSQYAVISSEAQWTKFLDQVARVSSSQAADLEDMDIDFRNQSLIVIIGKYFNYCCSKLTVEGVYEGAGNIVVEYRESGSGMATAISQAITLLKVPIP